MPLYEYRSRSVGDTSRLAERLASLFIPGTVLTLDGELGAGKTTFSQSVAKAIGVKEIVNSPTFTIIKEYEGERFPFYHMDVYRLSAEEADELGLDEYFYGQGVTLIEWASIIEDLLPPERLAVRIEHDGEQGRRFQLIPYGEPYEEWCLKLKENGYL
ncbi:MULTISPECIES: tRNA (adenosine(37)-N6)-threonylcarbamoyltransferase complex ATPase subunit type 1 TsaE [Paenibacillus]|uniref:tRNA threonylcarbamoyladenosine biosynthesis protein TsaE n=1 Tax=Paenibacillus naphthalenovorans TaxID=162209 RepID=A0A0U2VX68_9BACL|nr:MULTISPECIES: tRNA (adenosine(37)-N6)-threonylcarbamoyltransferase complex ATPase subunit type 1 TsaE [Paenibacillus]ALS25302.1 tRNA threonylcarbamoyladenosine biosynthesis protein TsaE [Paenibacillus naphthalenovorans]NTZ20210.1 tRNA (adenosine(37)-N6)-threonylcarbamoyltransferase complex ATPase subunit type 1 TsaE [Paenibacillus sp. JMULE4]GCL73412.1 tRNA (adenosine(37)-N6)-threonylcarbamoyltransferase complex ATPase subunit type 1 TsaE [Paenibacillus naphthalenovorans]SDI29688.1 tRNA thre